MALTGPSCGILVFSTSNYDAMRKFLADFGFKIEEGHDPLLPLTGKRGAWVSRGDLRFQLEEADDPTHRAMFHLFMTDHSDEEIQRIKSLGYKGVHEVSLYGEFHTFETPDGGMFVI